MVLTVENCEDCSHQSQPALFMCCMVLLKHVAADVQGAFFRLTRCQRGIVMQVALFDIIHVYG
jgi:hypothetical protein